jgi:hypothetical protein
MTDVAVVENEVKRKRGRPLGSFKRENPNGHRKLPQVTRDTLDGRTRIAHRGLYTRARGQQVGDSQNSEGHITKLG